MRAARYHGIRDVRIEDVPRPEVGRDDVLVRVAYAGICGSDLHVYAKGMFGIVPPMTMGHEFSGVVEAVGDPVTGLRPGDHVVGDPRLGLRAVRVVPSRATTISARTWLSSVRRCPAATPSTSCCPSVGSSPCPPPSTFSLPRSWSPWRLRSMR